MKRYRINIEIRQQTPFWIEIITTLGGVAAGLLTCAFILKGAGVSLGQIVQEFGASVFGSTQGLASVLVQAAPLLIVGLAAATSFRVRFWNIGIEGQMILGSIFGTAVALHDVGPSETRLLMMALAAMLGGIMWVAVPLVMRLRLGVSEIVSTLLLNYVAFNGLLHLLYGSWRDPLSSFPMSAPFDGSERLGLLGWENVTWALPVALLLAALCWWVFKFTRFGFLMKFAQANPLMAAAAGAPMTAVLVYSALASGALSGLAGFVLNAGVEYRMSQSFFVGYGFSGILIAFLARSNPIAVILVSVLIAILFVGGQSLQVFYQIPGSMVQLLQAVIVVSVAASDFFLKYRLRLISRESVA